LLHQKNPLSYTLHIGVAMSEIDLTPLKPAIESYIPLGRSGLLPSLHAAQKIYGWLPQEVAAEVAKALHVPLADVHGVIEFYSMFYNEPVGRCIVRVCTDPRLRTQRWG
jgi:NADH-quinone oxidoreductase subunit F